MRKPRRKRTKQTKAPAAPSGPALLSQPAAAPVPLATFEAGASSEARRPFQADFWPYAAAAQVRFKTGRTCSAAHARRLTEECLRETSDTDSDRKRIILADAALTSRALYSLFEHQRLTEQVGLSPDSATAAVQQKYFGLRKFLVCPKDLDLAAAIVVDGCIFGVAYSDEQFLSLTQTYGFNLPDTVRRREAVARYLRPDLSPPELDPRTNRRVTFAERWTAIFSASDPLLYVGTSVRDKMAIRHRAESWPVTLRETVRVPFDKVDSAMTSITDPCLYIRAADWVDWERIAVRLDPRAAAALRAEVAARRTGRKRADLPESDRKHLRRQYGAIRAFVLYQAVERERRTDYPARDLGEYAGLLREWNGAPAPRDLQPVLPCYCGRTLPDYFENLSHAGRQQ